MDQWCTHQSSDGLRLLNTKEHGTRTIEEIRASRIEDSRGTADYSRGAGQRGHQWARGSAARRRGAVATRRRTSEKISVVGPKYTVSCTVTNQLFLGSSIFPMGSKVFPLGFHLFLLIEVIEENSLRRPAGRLFLVATRIASRACNNNEYHDDAAGAHRSPERIACVDWD